MYAPSATEIWRVLFGTSAKALRTMNSPPETRPKPLSFGKMPCGANPAVAEAGFTVVRLVYQAATELHLLQDHHDQTVGAIEALMARALEVAEAYALEDASQAALSSMRDAYLHMNSSATMCYTGSLHQLYKLGPRLFLAHRSTTVSGYCRARWPLVARARSCR